MFKFWKKRPPVTLVLGGGSARGIAHIGVLKVFEREHIPIDGIVGTSMGALIGAAYAVGVPVKEMEAKANGFVMNKLLDPTMPRMGLLAGNKLEVMITELIHDKKFEDCRIPMAVVTTDIETGDEVIHKTGNLIKIIRASCSWPGIFNPVRIDGRLLSDGGIKSSVPTRIAKSLGAEYIIAVDVGFCVKKGKVENIFQMLLQSFQITGDELNKYQANEADVAIKVGLSGIDQIAFNRAKEIIAEGIGAAESMVDRIKSDLRI